MKHVEETLQIHVFTITSTDLDFRYLIHFFALDKLRFKLRTCYVCFVIILKLISLKSNSFVKLLPTNYFIIRASGNNLTMEVPVGTDSVPSRLFLILNGIELYRIHLRQRLANFHDISVPNISNVFTIKIFSDCTEIRYDCPESIVHIDALPESTTHYTSHLTP